MGREVRGEWGGERELWFDSALAAVAQAVKVQPFSLIGSKGCAKEKHSSIVMSCACFDLFSWRVGWG